MFKGFLLYVSKLLILECKALYSMVLPASPAPKEPHRPPFCSYTVPTHSCFTALVPALLPQTLSMTDSFPKFKSLQFNWHLSGPFPSHSKWLCNNLSRPTILLILAPCSFLPWNLVFWKYSFTYCMAPQLHPTLSRFSFIWNRACVYLLAMVLAQCQCSINVWIE